MPEYRPRIVDTALERQLKGVGAVLIEGPKWCGKTTTGMMHSSSVVFMDNPAELAANLQLADMDPQALLRGTPPLLIDEWQLAPKLWDAVRFEVDRRGVPGQFILTGSAVPPKTDDINHSGTGRFAWLTMRPMTLFESRDSSGDVSLAELFEGQKTLYGNNSLDLEKIAWLMCRGGWPMACSLYSDEALDLAFNYVDAVVRADIMRVDDIRRSSETARRVLWSYARHQATQASISTIAQDVNSSTNASNDLKTVTSYIEAFRKIFVIEDSEAWNPNLRSKSAIRSTPTRYFVDPSIGAAAMGVGPRDLLNDLNTMGLMFEGLCVRDLRVYAESIGGKVYHFRDRNGLECDAVIHLRNGSYALIEIKLGGDKLIDEGAANLLKLSSKIDTDRMKSPSFAMVLTAVGNRPYLRNDGVFVVPIGCLKN